MLQKKKKLLRAIDIFGIKLYLIPFIIIFCGVVLLLKLGNWQLSRWREKRDLIHTIENNLKHNPQLHSAELNKISPYIKLKLRGRFLPNKTIFVYGQRSALHDKNGYYVLTPFQTHSDDIILISRYWIPSKVKEKVLEHIKYDIHDKEITIFALPSEKRKLFVPQNDIERNIWFTIDLNSKASRLLNINVKHVYFLEINSKSIPKEALPLYTTHLNKIRNDHLEYAITWYALSFCLFIMYIIWEYKNQNKACN